MIEKLLEYDILPDWVLRLGIRSRLRQLSKQLHLAGGENRQSFVRAYADDLKTRPIAVATQEANEQHYELPTRFFQLCLGKKLKYSSGYWPSPGTKFDESEEAMLALSCERAELKDGMEILELGCGWGSLSLWMAEKYPHSKIVGVSNSTTQKEFIDRKATELNLQNLTIVTANMLHFDGVGDGRFDRVVSVEMFEHMKNYEELLKRVAVWMKPAAKLFVHIFTHCLYPYHFEVKSDKDWMAKYFFTGGQMPSDDLFYHFQDHLQLEDHWKVNGVHYSLTSENWLSNMDQHKPEIMELMKMTYGVSQARRWWVWWRLFYLACAELWGYDQGREWIVSHYRFIKKGVTSQ
jgi:cyclopropane-fatty-acyl-phospholipid synthase